jgi:hypothetical protein
MRTTPGVLIALMCVAAHATAQAVDTLNLAAVGTDPHWRDFGRTASVVDIKGKHAVRLSEAMGMGVVWLDTYDFADGTIEADILGRSQPVQGSFVDVARPRIQVFVDHAATPSLVVDELGPRTHGPIGLWVGEGSGGYFANLRVQKRTP